MSIKVYQLLIFVFIFLSNPTRGYSDGERSLGLKYKDLGNLLLVTGVANESRAVVEIMAGDLITEIDDKPVSEIGSTNKLSSESENPGLRVSGRRYSRSTQSWNPYSVFIPLVSTGNFNFSNREIEWVTLPKNGNYNYDDLIGNGPTRAARMAYVAIDIETGLQNNLPPNMFSNYDGKIAAHRAYLRYYRLAANEGNVIAAQMLADLLSRSSWSLNDFAEESGGVGGAVRGMNRLAAEGDHFMQLRLAYFQSNGLKLHGAQLVDRDRSARFETLRRLARDDYFRANYGFAYEQIHSGDADQRATGMRLMYIQKERGDVGAMTFMGASLYDGNELLGQDREEGANLLSEAASQGSKFAKEALKRIKIRGGSSHACGRCGGSGSIGTMTSYTNCPECNGSGRN